MEYEKCDDTGSCVDYSNAGFDSIHLYTLPDALHQ